MIQGAPLHAAVKAILVQIYLNPLMHHAAIYAYNLWICSSILLFYLLVEWYFVLHTTMLPSMSESNPRLSTGLDSGSTLRPVHKVCLSLRLDAIPNVDCVYWLVVRYFPNPFFHLTFGLPQVQIVDFPNIVDRTSCIQVRLTVNMWIG